MYLGHFGLLEMPFGITPDTSFAFGCSSHQEAINTLMVATTNGEGFMKVTGEVGTGKTLLCRRFLGMLGPQYVSAYIPNPYLEPRALLLALAGELSIALEREATSPGTSTGWSRASPVHCSNMRRTAARSWSASTRRRRCPPNRSRRCGC